MTPSVLHIDLLWITISSNRCLRSHLQPTYTNSKMVKPLLFKGEKPKKRKQRDPDSDKAPKTRKTEGPETDDTPEDQSWVSADAPTDIAGPIVLVLPSDKPTCIASDANGVVFASILENLVEGDPSTAEPHDVRQVWVATRVAGTESLSLKGHHGKCVFPYHTTSFQRVMQPIDTEQVLELRQPRLLQRHRRGGQPLRIFPRDPVPGYPRYILAADARRGYRVLLVC